MRRLARRYAWCVNGTEMINLHEETGEALLLQRVRQAVQHDDNSCFGHARSRPLL